jgi:hypothetical protein
MVDDSPSMRSHWNAVRELVQLLTYIVKDKDPDHCDLYFLSSQRHFKIRNGTEAYNAIKNWSASAPTTLNTCLNDEITRYLRSWQYGSTGRRPFRISMSQVQPRPRNIYVFTDGKLENGEPTQGQEAIRTLYQKAQQIDIMRGMIGIQFISFGSDLAGLNRLRTLDRLGRDQGFGM